MVDESWNGDSVRSRPSLIAAKIFSRLEGSAKVQTVDPIGSHQRGKPGSEGTVEVGCRDAVGERERSELAMMITRCRFVQNAEQ